LRRSHPLLPVAPVAPVRPRRPGVLPLLRVGTRLLSPTPSLQCTRCSRVSPPPPPPPPRSGRAPWLRSAPVAPVRPVATVAPVAPVAPVLRLHRCTRRSSSPVAPSLELGSLGITRRARWHLSVAGGTCRAKSATQPRARGTWSEPSPHLSSQFHRVGTVAPVEPVGSPTNQCTCRAGRTRRAGLHPRAYGACRSSGHLSTSCTRRSCGKPVSSAVAPVPGGSSRRTVASRCSSGTLLGGG